MRLVTRALTMKEGKGSHRGIILIYHGYLMLLYEVYTLSILYPAVINVAGEFTHIATSCQGQCRYRLYGWAPNKK